MVVVVIGPDGRVAASRFCQECIDDETGIAELARAVGHSLGKTRLSQKQRLNLQSEKFAAYEQALRECQGNVNRAASALGVDRSTIFKFKRRLRARALAADEGDRVLVPEQVPESKL